MEALTAVGALTSVSIVQLYLRFVYENNNTVYQWSKHPKVNVRPNSIILCKRPRYQISKQFTFYHYLFVFYTSRSAAR